MRMLYSPESNESTRRGGQGIAPAGSRCLSFVAVLPGGYRECRARTRRRPSHQQAQNSGIKEAQHNGMGRGFQTILRQLVFFAMPGHRLRFTPAGLALLLALCGLLAAAPSAHAQSAASWNKRGQAAEVRQDYDAAYEAYRHAHEKNPKDLRYTTRMDRMRYQAAASHVDRGRLLRQNGDTNGAISEFTRALQIDPAYEAAGQELQITQHPESNTPPPPSPGQVSAPLPGATGSAAVPQSDAMRELSEVTGPIEMKPLSTDPITMHIVEDTKVIYQAIGKAAGLNVLFDPDYNSKRIPVDLNRVSLEDALRIVGLISKTFYKPVTSDTIYVAANERQNHANVDDLAIQTFFLSNVSQQNDGNEIQTAIRQLLPPDSTKIYFVTSQNALVVRATTDQLLLVQKLLNDLDRPKPEVVVDVAILEVNKDHIRNLGITLPQSFGLTPQTGCTTSSCTTTSTNSTSTTSTTSTASSFTLNTLGNLNATNFAVSISGGTLNALLSDADTRVLQNPSIRATDGQRATLKIGSKIPIATGSYSAGAATGITAGIGVQTQFQYLDVGVNIDMTPTVHLDHDVSLKMKVEVSSQTGSVTISGVTEPIIGQRSIEHTIQLKEGEPSILAGILTKQDNATNSGTPGLAQIPLIKYLFGSQYKEVQQDEVVFVLIPHIVRESVLTKINTRAIDTGTNNDIQLRFDPLLADQSAALPATASNQSKTTAANAAAAAVETLKQQAVPPSPPGQTTPSSVPPLSLVVLPANSTQKVGTTFQVAVVATFADDVTGVPMQVQFDPKVLQLVNVDAGRLLSKDGQSAALVHRDEGNGMVTISTSRPPGTPGVSGQGDVCTLTFRAVAPGDSNITLVKVSASNSHQVTVPAVGSQAIVHIK